MTPGGCLGASPWTRMRSPVGRTAGVFVLFAGCLLSCARELPAAYVADQKRAEGALTRGDYTGCYEAWRAAANQTEEARDRDEALYRAAHCALRAGNEAAGMALLSELAARPGTRQSRAAFDRGYRLLHAQKSQPAELEAAILRFQQASSAPGALEHLLDALAEPAAQFSAIDRLLNQVQRGALQELLWYRQAQLWQAQKELSRSRESLSRLIDTYPYPEGRYWDEASLQLAQLETDQGRYPAAISVLERMLAQREEAGLIGSYERNFARAQFQLASIRERTHDWQRAYDEYLELVDDSPTSRLRDDAAWRAARLARAHLSMNAACAAAEQLARLAPTSAYVPCLSAVCDRIPPNPACHEYLLVQP